MLTGIHGPEVCRLHTQRIRLRQILSKIRENDLSAAKSTKFNAKQDNTCFLTVYKWTVAFQEILSRKFLRGFQRQKAKNI